MIGKAFKEMKEKLKYAALKKFPRSYFFYIVIIFSFQIYFY